MNDDIYEQKDNEVCEDTQSDFAKGYDEGFSDGYAAGKKDAVYQILKAVML